MRRIAIALMIMLFAACAQPVSGPAASTATLPEESPPPPATSSAPPQPPAPPAGGGAAPRTAEHNLELLHPAPGESVLTNPIVVEGRARTFENHVSIELLDEKGVLLRKSYATATGDLGTLNPFRAELFVPRTPGRFVTVRLLDYSAKDGSVREQIDRRVPFTVESRAVTLSFSKKLADPRDECNRVQTVTRELPVSRSALRAIVEALLAGPTEQEKRSGATDPFPPGATVREVNLRDGRAIVDFDERMVSVGGSCRAIAIRASVEQTLRAVPGVRSVEIRAGGSAAEALQP